MTSAAAAAPLLEVAELYKWFPVRSGVLGALIRSGAPEFVHAVDGVSFTIGPGEALGIVGESGSGKSTMGMTVLRLHEPTRGTIRFEGQDITRLGDDALRPFRRAAQIVFQNPYESLNPRFTVFDTVAEPLRLHGIGSEAERLARVLQALERAELHPAEAYLWRYPHELSGGQRQRLAIARAVVLEPKLLVADEAVSMLDVSIRAGVLNLLKRLIADMNLGLLYISHDLATVRYVCQRTLTMYAGQVIESARTEALTAHPLHPYTQMLIRAIPRVEPGLSRERVLLEGEVPSLVRPPAGCRFHPRCPRVMDVCRQQAPLLQEAEPGHWVACHLYDGDAKVES
jgi:oligopeptide/dipeptide ABC transporter ATP-binding protein